MFAPNSVATVWSHICVCVILRCTQTFGHMYNFENLHLAGNSHRTFTFPKLYTTNKLHYSLSYCRQNEHLRMNWWWWVIVQDKPLPFYKHYKMWENESKTSPVPGVSCFFPAALLSCLNEFSSSASPSPHQEGCPYKGVPLCSAAVSPTTKNSIRSSHSTQVPFITLKWTHD